MTTVHSGASHSATLLPSSLPESVFLEVLTSIKCLIDFQQRISTVNECGQSLLHLAVHLQYRELVQNLVDWGIDINIKDVNGSTALHTAYLCGDASITQMLEQHGTIHLSLDELGRPPVELREGYAVGQTCGLLGLSVSDGQ
jgi:ankyrin repeat protein